MTTDYNEMIAKARIPHIARYMRKHNPPIEGTEKCECCGQLNATRNRQRTAYQDEESNWVTLCPTCQKENDYYWDDMWDDYYSCTKEVY